jgi:hypothetical protein
MGYMKWLDRMGQMAEITAINSVNRNLTGIRKTLVKTPQQEAIEDLLQDVDRGTQALTSESLQPSPPPVAHPGTARRAKASPSRSTNGTPVSGTDDVRERLARLEERVDQLVQFLEKYENFERR